MEFEMGRFHKSWYVVWEGHHIEVRNWWSLLFRAGEELWINGELADSFQGRLGLSRDLHGTVQVGSKQVQISAHLGNIDWGLRIGCLLYADGSPIGGDVDKKFFT
ncbi:MAG: hypothetical protein MJE66_13575 [Proteobacteria bacterium]|nr:hypothetical protein [Pseudomonadota bacterium]